MNKDLVLPFIKSFEDMPLDISLNKEAIVDSVNAVLLSDSPITDNVRRVENIGDASKCRLDKSSISPMAHFLKDFKETVGMLNTSRSGIEFAVEYLKALQDFAQKTNAEEPVVCEINELLVTLSK